MKARVENSWLGLRYALFLFTNGARPVRGRTAPRWRALAESAGQRGGKGGRRRGRNGGACPALFHPDLSCPYFLFSVTPDSGHVIYRADQGTDGIGELYTEIETTTALVNPGTSAWTV